MNTMKSVLNDTDEIVKDGGGLKDVDDYPDVELTPREQF